MSYQSGITYGVATLGTAITPEHLRLLWQLAKEPVICLDGDTAGKRAMLRSAEIVLPLLKPSYSLRYAVLPQNEDPDSYIQKHGKPSFEKILLSSRRLSQVLWDIMVTQYSLDLPEGKAALDDACRKLAAKINDETVRQHYLTHFRKQLWTQTTTPASNPRLVGRKQLSETKNQTQVRSPQIEHILVQHHSAALDELSSRLLNILLKFPELLYKSQVEEILSQLDIRTATMNLLRNALLTASTNVDVNNRELFIDYIKQQLSGASIPATFPENIKPPYLETLTESDAVLLWDETVGRYEMAHLEHEFKELQESISHSMNEDDYKRMIELQNAVQKARARHIFAPIETDVA